MEGAKNLKELFTKILERMIFEKKGLKFLIWLVGIIALLAILLYPIIDANFLYYSRTNKRIEILQKVVELDYSSVSKDSRLENEYNSIIEDMGNQRNNDISNVFIIETVSWKKTAKFISGAWLFSVVGIVLLFSVDKNKGKRFTANNITASIFCLVIAYFLGYGCMKIPSIINFGVNIVLYQAIMFYLCYAIVGINNKK